MFQCLWPRGKLPSGLEAIMGRGRGGEERDLIAEFQASRLSIEGFAAQLEVPVSWVRYWVELARLKRASRVQS